MAVNLVAVLVAAIASMVIGFLWYGPLFGKQWMAMMKIKKSDIAKMKKMAGKNYAWTFIISLVTAYVLAVFIDLAGASTVAAGATIAFWAWLGFVATVTAGSVLWDGKSTNLYFLNNAFQLIAMVVMGAIIVWM